MQNSASSATAPIATSRASTTGRLYERRGNPDAGDPELVNRTGRRDVEPTARQWRIRELIRAHIDNDDLVELEPLDLLNLRPLDPGGKTKLLIFDASQPRQVAIGKPLEILITHFG